YNESYAENPEDYRKQLAAWVDHVRSLAYLGDEAPRVVLFSPIAHEDLGDPLLPDGSENNRRLEVISRITAEVAKEKGVPHVDLFSASRAWYDRADTPLTINGVHLSDEGNRTLAKHFVEKALQRTPQLDEAGLEKLRE